MDKLLALQRLNQDKNYEDKLVIDLTEYFITCLDFIPNLTKYEKEQLKLKLNILIDDSRRHSFLFNDLIDVVLNNENNL
jgi:hypothetical protein